MLFSNDQTESPNCRQKVFPPENTKSKKIIIPIYIYTNVYQFVLNINILNISEKMPRPIQNELLVEKFTCLLTKQFNF